MLSKVLGIPRDGGREEITSDFFRGPGRALWKGSISGLRWGEGVRKMA